MQGCLGLLHRFLSGFEKPWTRFLLDPATA